MFKILPDMATARLSYILIEAYTNNSYTILEIQLKTVALA